MAKKPISRVRRKKGAVLFAVISIMALLIAMASTAYYTARSAYNSVVSNYDYSQLYLSAISVSDMVIDAIANDSTAASTSADGSDATKNYYKSLRDAIINNLVNAGDSIYAYSPNITLDPSTATEDQIINQLREAKPAVEGALDGIVVEIKLDSVGAGKLSPTADPADTTKLYAYEHIYTLTTAAYYRGNSITVEDKIRTEILKIDTEIGKLMEKLADADSVLFGYIQDRINNLNNSKKEYEKSLFLVERKVKKVCTKPLLEPLKKWDSLSLEEKNQLALAVIDKVYLSAENGIDIHFAF